MEFVLETTYINLVNKKKEIWFKNWIFSLEKVSQTWFFCGKYVQKLDFILENESQSWIFPLENVSQSWILFCGKYVQ